MQVYWSTLTGTSQIAHDTKLEVEFLYGPVLNGSVSAKYDTNDLGVVYLTYKYTVRGKQVEMSGVKVPLQPTLTANPY